MQKFSTNTTTENVKLFTRDTSPYDYCQIKKPDTGKWVQKSTKHSDREEALLFAQEWYTEMCFLHKRGYSSTPTQFSNVCDIYVQELDKEQALHERTGSPIQGFADRRARLFERRYLDDDGAPVLIELEVMLTDLTADVLTKFRTRRGSIASRYGIGQKGSWRLCNFGRPYAT